MPKQLYLAIFQKLRQKLLFLSHRIAEDMESYIQEHGFLKRTSIQMRHIFTVSKYK